jgi:hypothetical protein
MAQKIQVLLIDDIDGSTAAETVQFGIDGSTYEVDLSRENAAKLRETLATYVGSARRANGVSRKARNGSAPVGKIDREQNAAVRDWARNNGYTVSDRGRIPSEIVEAYHAKK